MGNLAKQKGKAGENEFCKFLAFNLDYDTERNYNQADGCSADVDYLPYFIFEVKRREVLDLPSWWAQVYHAAGQYQERNKCYVMPVVAFRQNRKEWEFLLPATLIGLDNWFIRVDKPAFVRFAKNYIQTYSESDNAGKDC